MSRFVNKQVVSVCAAAAMTCAVGATLLAQRAPQTKAEVAKPGGKIPNAPKLALVKVADGFNDPTNVASAFDGSGRLFVVERVGRIKIVDKDGKVLPQPFLDLPNDGFQQNLPWELVAIDYRCSQ